MGAVNDVLVDDSFKVPSCQARMAVESALQLRAWIDEGQNRNVYEFIAALFESLNAYFKDTSNSLKTQKESMWRSFYQLQTSADFKAQWHYFLSKATTIKPTVTFYQHITMVCLKELIKTRFSTFTGQPGNAAFQLTTEEANALRYAAGYVCYKLIKKLEMSSTNRRLELISLLTNLTGGEGDGTAEDWTNLLDRGGLCHM